MRLHRLSALVLTLLGHVTIVMANNLASPYEALYFYFTYKIEWEVTNGDLSRRTIGFLCFPADGTHRPCNFDEFVRSTYDNIRRYINNGVGPFDLDGRMGGPHPPTIHELAFDLQEKFGWTAVSFDPGKLCSLLNPLDGYRPTINRFADIIQAGRRSGILAGDLIEDALGCLNGIYNERYAASATPMASGLQRWLHTQKGLTVDISQEKTPGGTIYDDIDWEDLYQSLQGSRSKSFMKNLRKDVNTQIKSLKQANRVHWNNIGTIQLTQDRLQSRNLNC